MWASPLRSKNRAAYASLGHSEHRAGVRDQVGTLSAISVERCPRSPWNAVRHHSGTVSGIAWNTQQDIAGVLRHRSVETTQIYAKVDVTGLMHIAQPWVEVSPC